jgi:hypothetical protein
MGCSTHPGRLVILNRSVRFFGTHSNSVHHKRGIDRFQKNLGTEGLRFITNWVSIGSRKILVLRD